MQKPLRVFLAAAEILFVSKLLVTHLPTPPPQWISFPTLPPTPLSSKFPSLNPSYSSIPHEVDNGIGIDNLSRLVPVSDQDKLRSLR